MCTYEREKNGKVEVNDVLLSLNEYIVRLAKRNIPYWIIPRDVLDLEIDELAQEMRAKLWEALQKGHIQNLKAYLKAIAYTEKVNMIRRYSKTGRLILDQSDESGQGHVLIKLSQGMQDPAEEFEQQEMLDDNMQEVVKGVLALPPQQRRAVIYSIQERSEDILPFAKEFDRQGLNIRGMSWPKEGGKAELQSLRVSLSVARNKLRPLKSRLQGEKSYNKIACSTVEHAG